jgi:hypothetical protein
MSLGPDAVVGGEALEGLRPHNDDPQLAAEVLPTFVGRVALRDQNRDRRVPTGRKPLPIPKYLSQPET